MRKPLRLRLFGLVALLTCGLAVDSVPAADFDLVVRGARVADGRGGELFKADVAVKDGRIVAVGSVVGTSDQEIDASGRVVAPGFIDVHTHSETVTKYPDAENFLRMGVTTIVTGNCGTSRTDIAEFFSEIEAAGVAVNVASLIGHNSVRRAAMAGSFNRRPSREQLLAMTGLVDQAMQDGAVGLSTGLIYNPGSFSGTEEIIALAKAAAARGGIYASHMRSEGTEIVTALEEVFRICREADIAGEISHMKCYGPSTWGQAGTVLALLDQARADGLEITHDCYAYTASSTAVRQLIPAAALEGSREDYVARIMDPVKKATIVEQMHSAQKRNGYEDYRYAVIAQFRDDPSLNGLNIAEVAMKVRGSDSLDEQVEMILDLQARGGGLAVFHSMSEDDLVLFLQHGSTMIASDGGTREFGADAPHPRSYGNAARFLARYVRDQKRMTLGEGIRRLTSLPAQTFHLENRGVIQVGAIADLVVFDIEAVNDPASYAEPHQYAQGFGDVVVNGVSAIRAGELTGSRSGGAVRLAEPQP